MKKEFNLYLKSNNILKDLNAKIKETEEGFWKQQSQVTEYLKDHTREEATEFFKKDREENKKKEEAKKDLYNFRKTETLKNDLLFNNFIYKFINKYDLLFINILEKYKNKNIGEKTKEKIQEEIKETIQEKIFKNSEIYIYFNGEYNNYNLSIQFREKKEDRFIYQFTYTLQKHTTYNCYEEAEKITYNRYKASNFNYNKFSIDNLLYLDNINKEVKNIIKEEEKQKQEIEKQVKTIQEKVKKYNNLISSYNLNGDLEKNYKIDKTIYLY